MAAFSRGLGLGLTQHIFSFVPKPASKTCLERSMTMLPHTVRCSPILQATRNFQIFARLQASKQVAKTKSKPRALQSAPSKPPAQTESALPSEKRPAPTPEKKNVSSHHAGVASVVAARLAASGPTTLYQSPSHFWLRFSSISAAVFLISYAGINYYLTLTHPQPDLAWWVPVAFSLICFVSAVVGSLFLFSIKGIVRRITAVPTASLPTSYLRGGKKLTAAEKKALDGLLASPIALDCEVGGTLPLLGRRRLIAAPSQVLLPFKFKQAPVSRAGAQTPAKTSGLMQGLRRGLTSEGFAPIMINGKRFKIDILSGKVSGDGSVLDSLMPYRPERFSDTWLHRLLKR